MTVKTAIRRTGSETKCSKPAGEYCRLHNPAPSARTFNNINDVFATLEAESPQHPAFMRTKPEPMFQNVTVVRTLPDGIPALIEDHVKQNEAELNHITAEQRKAIRGYTGFAAGICNIALLKKSYEYVEDAPLWRESPRPALDFSTREDLVDFVETVDEALTSRQKERRIVYRGMPIYESFRDEIGKTLGREIPMRDTEGLIEGLEKYYQVGKVINHPTYLSTTRSAYYAADCSDTSIGTGETYYDKPEIRGIVFEMKTNAGLDVTALAEHRSYEREVLLPRDTHFKVVNVYVRPEKYETVSGYDIAHLPDELYEDDYMNLAAVVQMVEVDVDGNEITHTKPHKPVPSVEDAVTR